LLLGTALLGEPLEPSHVAGMALIGAGLAAIDGRPLALARARLWRAFGGRARGATIAPSGTRAA